MMTSRVALVVPLLFSGALALAGCSSDPGVVVEHDAATTRDAGTTSDGGTHTDAGVRRDAAVTCPAGQHACGAGCITDQPNDPANGCQFGCGAACPTPAMGVASCSSAGACDFTCPPPFMRVGNTCGCMALTCADMGAMCGSPDDGCGTPLDCGTCASGATCLDGLCGCLPDAHEPNDSNAVATSEPGLDDSADSMATFTDFTIDHMGDVDWIQLHVNDGFDFGNPHLYVRLYNIPSGSDFDLGVWYACSNSGNGSTCAVGTQDNMIGRGCTSSHTGIAEENIELPTDCGFLANASGTMFIRVTAPTFGGSCAPYALDVRVR